MGLCCLSNNAFLKGNYTKVKKFYNIYYSLNAYIIRLHFDETSPKIIFRIALAWILKYKNVYHQICIHNGFQPNFVCAFL